MMPIDRKALLEEYERTRIRRVNLTARKRDNYSKEDPLNLPRHRTNCLWFEECPLCYKCRNYDSKYVKCLTCNLNKTDGICHKRNIHTPEAFAMMITRERIEVVKSHEK